MLSTIHSADAVKIGRRDGSTIMKPTCIADYTWLMGGVDLPNSPHPKMVEKAIFPPNESACSECLCCLQPLWP